VTINPTRLVSVGETIFAGTADVIHDFVATFLDDRFAEMRAAIVLSASSQVVCSHFPSPRLPARFEWMKNAIGICLLD